MMDIKDKLELLKKQRQVRSRNQTRSGKILETWERIDRDQDNLTTKEKLQRLIKLTEKKPGPRSPRPAPEIPPAPAQPFQVFENSYGLQVRYGRTVLGSGLEIKGEVLSFLGRSAEFEPLDLASALIIDLETTGLAGGTGTVPFLVGMGFYRDGLFRVVQYFLHDLAEEGAMMKELGRFFQEMDFRSIITYNGRAFDLPILETRFILHRQRLRLAGLPHLDFLFAARGLWKHKHENCRLFHLAREVVQADRSEDIPSAEIPHRYFEYIRSGDFSLIEPILYHNQEDILSLLGLVITGATLSAEGRQDEFISEMADAMDLYGLGNMFARAGQREQSARLFQRALEGRLTEEVALRAKKKLSHHYKKEGKWGEAVAIWLDMTSQNQISSYRELAIHYEHREKNYEEAIRIVEEGLALSRELDSGLHQDFSQRLKRLKAKAKQRGGPAKAK
jgi:uncharacterized protein YprB with RNaseH-like and TPR domain